MQQSLLQELQQYGLTEKEAKVYLVILEIGNSIVSTIARRSAMNRTSTYEILSNLKNKGIAFESTKDEVKYFSVIAPEMLLHNMEMKTEKFKSKLPEFLAIMGKWGNKPKVEYYEGLEGIKTVFEIVLAEGNSMTEPYLSFMGTDIDMDAKLVDYLKNVFAHKRIKCPVKTRVIASSKNNSEYMDFNLNTHEALIIEDDMFEMGNEMVIYGKNKVAVLMYDKEEQSGLIIESSTLHDGLKSVFNLIWKLYKTKTGNA